VPRTVADGAASLRALSSAVPDAQRKGLRAAETRAERSLAAAVLAASGGDNRLSHAGRVGVRSSESAGSARISALGPFYLLEGPVSPHTEEPSSRRALAGGLRHPVASVRHPGVRARREWSRATGRTASTLGEPWSDELGSALFDAYRGG